MMLNTSIIGAGCVYFTDLVGAATWTVTPAEADTQETYAKMAQELLFDDPVTSWRRIMRRASMYKFWGYSFSEWVMRKRPEGWLTYHDVAPRAQRTIEYWNVDPTGEVHGIWQRSPQTQEYFYIPRGKTIYLVDDTLNDRPDGLGLFRLMVEASQRLKAFERQEGLGYEQDMRGVAKFFYPLHELNQLVKDGRLEPADRDKYIAPIKALERGFVTGKVRTMSFDSGVYQSQDNAGRPSSIRRWDAEIMKGGSVGFETMFKVIDRYERQMARVMGMEGLLLGGEKGSYALSRDKTDTLYTRVAGTLESLRHGAEHDLLRQAWMRNGWPDEMMPMLTVTPPGYVPPEEMATTIKTMADALKAVDDTAILEDADLEVSARKLVAVIERVDAALISAGGGSA